MEIGTDKAKVAFLVPFALSAVGVVANWVESGVFDAAEIRVIAAGALTAVATAFATYWTPAGPPPISDEEMARPSDL